MPIDTIAHLETEQAELKLWRAKALMTDQHEADPARTKLWLKNWQSLKPCLLMAEGHAVKRRAAIRPKLKTRRGRALPRARTQAGKSPRRGPSSGRRPAQHAAMVDAGNRLDAGYGARARKNENETLLRTGYAHTAEDHTCPRTRKPRAPMRRDREVAARGRLRFRMQ